MMINGSLEVVSIGAFAPLLSLLLGVSPKGVELHLGFLNRLTEGLIPPSRGGGIVLLIGLFGFSVLCAGSLRILVTWLSSRLTAALGADLSTAVYENLLNRPYLFHVQTNGGFLISLVTDKAQNAVSLILYSLNFFSSLLIGIFICGGLILWNPLVSFLAGGSLVICYGVIGFGCLTRLKANSMAISREFPRALKAAQEGLGAIRDVILDQSQKFYVNLFRHSDFLVRQAGNQNIFLSTAPRYATETAFMVAFCGAVYFLARSSVEMATVVSSVGVIALGAQRLMPLVQMAYSSWTMIKGNTASLDELLRVVETPSRPGLGQIGAVSFQKNFSLQKIRFKYPKRDSWVLSGIDMKIRKGEKVGIVGKTGCGKSTLLDVIMGLLPPTEGEIKVDQTVLNLQNLQSWQRSIAHVPQTIFLADVSIAENIALGSSAGEVDFSRVREAARLAQIDDFIQTRPEGYAGRVGDRGVLLSGGQRQRIGIARALYRRPQLLILDEATSALDHETEKTLMDGIGRLTDGMTVLMVAHRLSSLALCHRVLALREGRLEELSLSDLENLAPRASS